MVIIERFYFTANAQLLSLVNYQLSHMKRNRTSMAPKGGDRLQAVDNSIYYVCKIAHLQGKVSRQYRQVKTNFGI